MAFALKKSDQALLKYHHGPISIRIAKFIVSHSTERRMMVYSKLQSLLKNHFSVMDALDRLYQTASREGRDPEDAFAIAILEWIKMIKNGESFSVAVKGWVPLTEVLTLSVGDVANLEIALENTIKAVDGVTKMKAPVVSAVSYPMVLLVMVSFLIYGVGAYMVPPMVDAVPGIKWRGTAKSLVDLSAFVQAHPILLFSFFPILTVIVVLTFPRWKGKGRVFFDSIPPWSIYRIFIGVSWLLSLSALVRAGTPVSRAMQNLKEDATPYLRHRISAALFYINNGENLGDALDLTGLRFPDEEIIGDLKIYAELDNFSEALSNLSTQWLEGSVKMIEARAAVINSVAILLISALVAWTVFGTFAMQDQMTSGMGIA